MKRKDLWPGFEAAVSNLCLDLALIQAVLDEGTQGPPQTAIKSAKALCEAADTVLYQVQVSAKRNKSCPMGRGKLGMRRIRA